MKDVVRFLTPEQKLYPAKHHYWPSSVHRFPTKPTNSCRGLRDLCKAMNFKGLGYRNILKCYTVQRFVASSTYPVPCLSQTEPQRVHQSMSFQQIKNGYPRRRCVLGEPHAHGANELLRMIADKDASLPKINTIAGCALH